MQAEEQQETDKSGEDISAAGLGVSQSMENKVTHNLLTAAICRQRSVNTQAELRIPYEPKSLNNVNKLHFSGHTKKGEYPVA